MQTVNPSLEAEYNNRVLVPDHLAIFERWRRDSVHFCETTACTLDIVYGEEPRNKLDFFHAKNSRGTVIFIHGGYWRSLDKADFSFVAKPFIDAGLDVALINYRLCPSVRISEAAGDCRQALVWIIENGGAHDMSVDRIALAGHSAGGHLVAMLYATDWQQLRCNVSNVIGGMALSGVYDLEPLIHCSMNADLNLNHHTARASSPIKLAPTLTAPLYLAVGADESRAFREQSRLLSVAWPKICAAPEEILSANHFTVVDYFAQPTHETCLRVVGLFS